ncbi:MAG: O-antigen ligase family protein [Acetatifactor sp.]|nr:O-antigen ligase family protein [Acetatifactor sp.]
MHRDKRKRGPEPVAVTLRRYTYMILDVVICIYMLLILVVMPFYNEEGYTHIGTDKSVFFFKVSIRTAKAAVPLLILYLIFSIKASRSRRGNLSRLWDFVKENMSVTDLFAGAYGISLLLSYLFSRYKSDALWGASGWYMGLYRQLILIGIYFYISKLWKPEKWIFYTILPVSAAVFLLEYLNRFDVFLLDMGSYGSMFISTIGNINWYCGYQVSVFFAGMALFWQGAFHKMWQRLLLMAYILLGFASLVTQGSNSGIVTMAAVILIMFCMSVPDGDGMYRFWQEMVLLGGACLLTYGIQHFTGRKINYEDVSIELLASGEVAMVITIASFVMLALAAVGMKTKRHPEGVWRTLKRICVGLVAILLSGYAAALIVNTLQPGSIGVLSENPAFLFSNTWGSNRGATWKAGVLCFWEQDILHKLVGVGPDAMEAYIYHNGSPRLLKIVTTTFPTAWLTNAHNEWLTVLANTGLLGFVSYVGLTVSGMVRFLNKKNSSFISCACGFCLLGYTVNNMFSFQQSVNAATIFVILGMGEAFYRKNKGIQ